jgi:hypothetical protein
VASPTAQDPARRGAFRRAVEAHDLERMMALFAEDAVLHSPITFQPFEGRAAIRELLGIILEVFQGFHYTRECEGIDLIRFDASGAICDLTVLVRPRSALEALLGEVAPRLASARSAAATR